jgi:hypothetical protein
MRRTITSERLALGDLLHEECLLLLDVGRESFFDGFLYSCLDIFSLLLSLDLCLLLC